MKDKQDNINVTLWKKKINHFVKEREWEKFHTPKNIASALSVEASELLEIFQWLTPEESVSIIKNKKINKAISEELSDILVYTIRLADLLKIDLNKSMARKFKINKEKYPKHKVRGSAKKYTEY